MHQAETRTVCKGKVETKPMQAPSAPATPSTAALLPLIPELTATQDSLRKAVGRVQHALGYEFGCAQVTNLDGQVEHSDVHQLALKS